LLNYDSPQAIRAYLDQRGLGIRKRLGQNFLINGGARRQLLDALAIAPGDRVWEIGPGLGAMTAGLLERGAELSAFELDRGFIAALEEFFGGHRGFRLIPGDALKTWPAAWAALGREAGEAPSLLGNLPYHIAAALLADFIEKNCFFKRMVVTVQREVARRMAAKPGSADYSSFSVLCASAYAVTPLMVLKGASFYPPPRVDSQGILLELRSDIDPAGYPAGFKPLVRSLFSSRRKTIKNNLQNYLNSRILTDGGAQDLALDLLERIGVSPKERAENLGPEEFSALAAALSPGQDRPGDR
jgi:16S rRNA (adenine1518-N6/adenine1519-N6)-dimethyltransferase